MFTSRVFLICLAVACAAAYDFTGTGCGDFIVANGTYLNTASVEVVWSNAGSTISQEQCCNLCKNTPTCDSFVYNPSNGMCNTRATGGCIPVSGWNVFATFNSGLKQSVCAPVTPTPPPTPVSTCGSSSDCANGQGICEANGYCSCLSGFGGSNDDYLCSSKPSSTCNFNNVNSMSLSNNVSVSFTIDNTQHVNFGVQLPLEKSIWATPSLGSGSSQVSGIAYSTDTVITFGGSSSNACNYPSGPHADGTWQKSTSSCTDSYALSMPWSRIGSLCGFSTSNNASYLGKLDMSSYIQVINVTRNYLIPFGNTYKSRSVSSAHLLEVFVPNTVVLTSNFVSLSTHSYSAFISGAAYDVATGFWKISIQTVVLAPYKFLDVAQVIVNGDLTVRIIANNITGNCSSNNQDCYQQIDMYINNCNGFSGGAAFGLDVVCSGGQDASCSNPTALDWLNVTISALNACPIVINPSVSGTIAAYKDSAYSVVGTQFGYVDTAYVRAVISSPQITVSQVTPVSLCATNKVRADAACSPIVYSASASGGNSVNLAINLTQLTALAANISGPQNFVFNITLAIQYTSINGKREVREEVATLSGVNMNEQFNFELRSADAVASVTTVSNHFATGGAIQSVISLALIAIMSFFAI